MRVRFSATSSILATAMSSRPPVSIHTYIHLLYVHVFSFVLSTYTNKLYCHSIYSTEVAVLEHSPTSFPPVSSPATLIFNQFETLIEAVAELINISRNLILGFRILSIDHHRNRILMLPRCVIIRTRRLGLRLFIIINNSLGSSFSLRSSRINIRGRS